MMIEINKEIQDKIEKEISTLVGLLKAGMEFHDLKMKVGLFVVENKKHKLELATAIRDIKMDNLFHNKDSNKKEYKFIKHIMYFIKLEQDYQISLRK